ncbi:hypothetical protein CONPUDRAFT_79367 [Coniophora puteana RWD-64-598 SS2]|uniref:Uncharacterized protein n=1 Tax=Coniophora puteana (strain RWD-64-598) TaxID=741705 RepID=A0A5M3N8P6_CONPW|nr:uncharacterized protein CONPUDRAFT_79367 [Coniophora puteana RWD-64-598 SS2]EIW87215.1 hypothetical protein CONPUDRAFT_79367 [Coniophora puteana RWD-64-598 SS2]
MRDPSSWLGPESRSARQLQKNEYHKEWTGPQATVQAEADESAEKMIKCKRGRARTATLVELIESGGGARRKRVSSSSVREVVKCEDQACEIANNGPSLAIESPERMTDVSWKSK